MPILAAAAIQFDVFLGHDGLMPSGGWFPAIFEVKNDGPPFQGFIQISPGLGDVQVRRIPVELPTGTLKRVTIPTYASRRVYSWEARLVDERGKTRAEQPRIRPRRTVAQSTVLMGAVPRTPSGLPSLPALPRDRNQDYQPAVARYLVPIFPDNPIVLETLDCLYVSSEKLAEFSDAQARAIRAWLSVGGHLIVGVEEPGEITATPWLKDLLPCDMLGSGEAPAGALETWLRLPEPQPRVSSGATVSGVPYNLQMLAPDFSQQMVRVARVKLRDGEVLAGTAESPLMVSARRGYGRLTLLLTSPEREPLKSWNNLPSFWAKLSGVPAHFYSQTDQFVTDGWSVDGVFGSLTDSRQVRKLPIGWLLLLLVAYVVIVGPLDRHWLKKVGKPMLTWFTLPFYVAVFSGLIYLIGYKLRAGETEVNELTVIDVTSAPVQSGVRGRSYVSIYSPVNDRYRLKGQARFAALRGESTGTWGGSQDSRDSVYLQQGDSAVADVFVPVWSSQLYVADWWDTPKAMVNCRIERGASAAEVVISNPTQVPLTGVTLVRQGRVYTLRDVPAGQTLRQNLPSGFTPLEVAVADKSSGFYQAITSRNRAFGGNSGHTVNDPAAAVMAVSFLPLSRHQQQQHMRIEPTAGASLGTHAESDTLLIASTPGWSAVEPWNEFQPKRSNRTTCWRVLVQDDPTIP